MYKSFLLYFQLLSKSFIEISETLEAQHFSSVHLDYMSLEIDA